MRSGVIAIAFAFAHVLVSAVDGDAAGGRPPLRLETVTFAGDSATFTGTIAWPSRAGLVPALVMLHGSEPGRRDGLPAQRLRERLVPRGIAVLSFDKRGVGGSSGRYREMPDLREAASDGLAALRYLASRPEVDSMRVGVYGASQGGWVGPLMASRSPRVAFVVSVSGPGVTPREQSRFEDGSRLREAGLDDGDVAEVDSLRDALIAYWERGEGAARDRARSLWRAALTRPWFDVAVRVDPLFSRLGRLAAPPAPSQMPREYFELLAHMRYDPVPAAERVRVPVLHVYGAGDRHLPVEESVRRLRPAYRRAGNRDVTFDVLPRAGHGLQALTADHECVSCPPDSARASWRLAPGAAELVDRWLLDRASRRAPAAR